jgi:hypothetical protein
MKFYCPSCQKEYEVEPKETITTKSGRVAYKATCAVCATDMAEFIPGEKREVGPSLDEAGKVGVSQPPAKVASGEGETTQANTVSDRGGGEVLGSEAVDSADVSRIEEVKQVE